MATASPTTSETVASALSQRELRRRTFRSYMQAAWKLRMSVAGGIVLLILVFIAVAAPVLSPYTPNEGRIAERLQQPVWQGGSWSHPLGTDGIGRDYATRLMYGARVALAVGLLATIVAGAIGIFLGLVAGYFGGKIDGLISTLVNVMMTFPFILLALAVIAVLGASFTNVVIVLGVGSWPIYTRVIKFEVERIKSLDYIHAGQVIGAGHARLIRRHIMPNLMNAIIVIGTVQVARLIIAEAFLSFLGLGVQPPTPSWGYMLQESQAFMFSWSDVWLPTLPGLAIFITTLSINFVGDGLR
ncbi:MAG: ABC transporter permease, partial [Chloroflexia bacterium]|nr:ABC transporter permease [Chloroflexia bacterium]